MTLMAKLKRLLWSYASNGSAPKSSNTAEVGEIECFLESVSGTSIAALVVPWSTLVNVYFDLVVFTRIADTS